MGRALQAIDYGDRTLTVDVVHRLFQNLIAPFGEDHPYSCVPPKLTEGIGRPSSSWPFLRQSVVQLFRSWGMVPKGGREGDGEPLALTNGGESSAAGGGGGAA